MKTRALVPCRSPLPVTGRGAYSVGKSCEIDNLCTTGNCRRSSLIPFRTNSAGTGLLWAASATGCVHSGPLEEWLG